MDSNLTAETYLDLFQNQIGPALEEVVLEDQMIWYQMDGCPAYNSRLVREYLENAFNGNIIGSRYRIFWPARSPDFSPNDSFLWGHLKSDIYKSATFQNLNQLQNAVSLECNKISQYQLSNVRN